MRLTPIIIHNLFFQFDSARCHWLLHFIIVLILTAKIYYCLKSLAGACLMDNTVQSFFLLVSFEGVHGTVGPKEIPS